MLSVSQLLMTRFCHDIIGPVGAVNNGVEFMEEGSSMDKQAFSLIADSARQCMHRLQFYRFIYGILKDQGMVDLNEKREMIGEFYNGSKHEVFWESTCDTITQQQCQIMCNLLLIASSALLRGGTLTISMEKDTSSEALVSVRVHAAGATVRLDEGIHHMLTASALSQPDTRTVQAYYTRLLLERSAGMLELVLSDETCLMTYKVSM